MKGNFIEKVNGRPILVYCCFVLVSLYLWPGCSSKTLQKDEPPKNLIAEAEFAKLLVDFALAESAVNTNVKNVTNRQTDSVYAFDLLLEHKVRKTQYDSTLTYYSMHIEEYKKVYENVLEILSAMQANKNGVKADSVLK